MYLLPIAPEAGMPETRDHQGPDSRAVSRMAPLAAFSHVEGCRKQESSQGEESNLLQISPTAVVKLGSRAKCLSINLLIASLRDLI